MSIILRGIHIASKHLFYLLLIATIILAVLIATTYWLSNAIEQRQDEISDFVSEQLGYPVEIAATTLDWVGLMPKLQVQTIKVFSQDQKIELFTLDDLYLGLDVIDSIQRREPVLKDLIITGLRVVIIRNETGQLQVQGLDDRTQSSPIEMDWFSWANLLKRFHLQDISIDYTDQQNSALTGIYQLADTVVIHKTGQWIANGNLNLPSSVGNNVTFTAQSVVSGNNWQASTWQWQIKTNGLKLAPLAQHLVWQDVAVQQGSVDITVSGTGVGDRIETINLGLDLAQSKVVTTQENTAYTPVVIERFIGQFNWQQQAELWQLSGRNIQLHINGDAWPQTAFTIRKDSDNNWLMASKYLRLSDITALASLSQHSPALFRQQQPAGDVEMFNLRYSATQGVEGLAFSLRDGALLPWQNYPGVTGLTASVRWQDGVGSLNLDSHQITLYPEVWLDDAIFFDSISGVLSLQKDDDFWIMNSQAVRVWNDDLTLQLDGSIEHTKDGKIINDLTLTLEEVAINKWQSYVPQRILTKAFKGWANYAFLAGKIVDGKIEMRGDLAAFPYDKSPDKGQFNLVLQAENIRLHYAPDWPDIVGVTGVVTGSGNDLIIKSKHGTVAGFKFADVTTTINKLVEEEPILRIKGEIKGSTANALQFLQQSPLKQRFGCVIKAVEVSGASNVQLNLMVPLADPEATDISGSVSFINSQIHKKSLPDVALTEVNGELQFTNNGVTANNIQASLFTRPVTIDVMPKDDKTIVVATGQIVTKKIGQEWPNNVPDFISGQTDYQLEVSIFEKELGDFYVDATLQSTLQGLELALPEPFAKASKDKILFKATVEHSGEELVYSINYGELVNAVVIPDESLWRGEIRFGEGQAMLPELGIKIRGQLVELAIDDWLKLRSAEQQKEAGNKLVSSIDDISISIAKVTGFNQQLTALNVSAQKDAQGWRTNLHSDQTRGFIYLPTDFSGSSTLKIDLDKVVISLPEKISQQDEKNEYPLARLWPSMDLAIKSLTVNDMPLGELSLQAHRSTTSWTLDSAILNSDVFTASIPLGTWQQSATEQRSHFQVKANSNDLATLLSTFGYQQAIAAENVVITMDFSWPSSPLDVSSKNIAGEISLDIGKGKLEEIEPGAVGRVFGLLSAATIPRRLALDFSDLFGKGFSFDSITGTFNIANGLAVTDDFALKGAAATIEMAGPIDLINKEYDQQVKITPNVSSTLPVAGAVAGGPVGLGVGTAIMLVDKLTDKLFDKNLVNLISYKYNLTGSWDAPQLNTLKPLNTVKPLNTTKPIQR